MSARRNRKLWNLILKNVIKTDYKIKLRKFNIEKNKTIFGKVLKFVIFFVIFCDFFLIAFNVRKKILKFFFATNFF